MLSRKPILFAWRNDSPKITKSYFWSEFFWKYAPYNYLSGFCSEFFDLSCRSIYLKLFSLCCSVFPDSAPVYLFAILQTLNLLFPCKNLWAIKRNSRTSWKSLFPVEGNYFNRVLTSLISLWWVMYEGSFQVCAMEGDEIRSLECQTLKLGDAPMHP